MNRDNDPRLTGAVVPVTLVQKDGTEFELRSKALSDRDMDEIDAWLRQEYMRRIEDATKLCAPEVKAAMLAQACAAVAVINFMDGGLGSRMIASISGLARLVWQSTRQEHPTLGFNDVKQLLLNSENRNRARKSWEDTNLGPKGKPLEKPPVPDPAEQTSTAP